MKNLHILTATAATFSTLALPAMAQSGQDQWEQRAGDQRDQRDEWNDRSGAATAARGTTMRAGPQQDYPAVRTVSRNGRVTVHGCLADRSWCDVSYGNDRGWVSGADLVTRYQGRDEIIRNQSGGYGFVTLTFSFGDYWENYYRQRPFYNERYRWEQHYFDNYQPSWGQRPSRSYWGERIVYGYSARKTWLRTGPDNRYPALRQVGRNVRIGIHGCLRDWSWCDVSFQRDRGWIPGRDIVATYQGRRRNINLIAPYLGIGFLSFSFTSYWDQNYRDRSFYGDRQRWEQDYNRNYKPIWGPAPDNSRDRDQNWQDSQPGNKKPRPGDPDYMRPGQSDKKP